MFEFLDKYFDKEKKYKPAAEEDNNESKDIKVKSEAPPNLFSNGSDWLVKNNILKDKTEFTDSGSPYPPKEVQIINEILGNNPISGALNFGHALDYVKEKKTDPKSLNDFGKHSSKFSKIGRSLSLFGLLSSGKGIYDYTQKEHRDVNDHLSLAENGAGAASSLISLLGIGGAVGAGGALLGSFAAGATIGRGITTLEDYFTEKYGVDEWLDKKMEIGTRGNKTNYQGALFYLLDNLLTEKLGDPNKPIYNQTLGWKLANANKPKLGLGLAYAFNPLFAPIGIAFMHSSFKEKEEKLTDQMKPIINEALTKQFLVEHKDYVIETYGKFVFNEALRDPTGYEYLWKNYPQGWP